jgi:transcription antitermination factor NusG
MKTASVNTYTRLCRCTSMTSERRNAAVSYPISVEGVQAVSNKYEFSKGESVRIKVGVFRAFTGKVSEIHERKSTLTVIVEVSGKPQSIELTFLEVEKLDGQISN